jgi:hypothetical protein
VNLDEECITVYFQNLKKLMKNIKVKLTEKDNEIGLLNYDKKDLFEEMKHIKQNSESYNKLNNLNSYAKEDELTYYKNLARQYENVNIIYIISSNWKTSRNARVRA